MVSFINVIFSRVVLSSYLKINRLMTKIGKVGSSGKSKIKFPILIMSMVSVIFIKERQSVFLGIVKGQESLVFRYF